ncbi:ABC transporter substrate-binding protein [Aquibacillus sp. 3ASR75-11]|uniref:ABC transporter substrate-binding protein n=1 Tax=Terrihalobacillus insolitus TaxID=2950438 RepID=A0A9X3WUD1_9BACI|nr:ABC transporter substrate-binding protein [Terrihalobacillus insolitus]MDC3413789.1 ABC transporter substrate-binding protein [Terrihalobacillus insolitus]MDC3425957.1 ABC transporter substrate-binding protein [Terrihalobacillus insolitus]
MKKLVWLLFLSLFLVLVAGCSYENPESASSEPEQSGEEGEGTSDTSTADIIKVGLDVDAGSMDPRLAKDTSAARVEELVYDGLVRLNANLEPEPALATEWENPDETTWIFTLREDVTFQDGEPFTAEDVKYTFDTILDPDFQAPYLSLYEPIKSVEVIDETHVKFNLKEPYAPLLSYLDIGIVPKHIAEKGDVLSSEPVGTGPYKMVNWEKNNQINFEANEDYWGGTPKTPKITYFIIPDNTTRVAALESGDVDFVHSPLSPQDISRIEKNDEFKVEKTQALGFTYLNYNMKNEILSDVKIRQALSHLVNKNVISEEIYQGMDSPGKSPLIPASWAYTDNVPEFEYDPDKALELFAEAGWEDTDGDGILDKDGKKLSLTLSTHSEDPNRIQIVEYLQNEFTQVGVETEVLTNEWPTFSTSLMEGNFDIGLVGWLNLVGPDRAMYNQFYSDSGSNYGKYSNARVDELLEKGRRVSDQAERTKIYQEAAKIVTEEVAYDVLLYQGYIAMYDKNLNGFEIHPTGSLYGLKDAELTN